MIRVALDIDYLELTISARSGGTIAPQPTPQKQQIVGVSPMGLCKGKVFPLAASAAPVGRRRDPVVAPESFRKSLRLSFMSLTHLLDESETVLLLWISTLKSDMGRFSTSFL